MIYVLDKNPTLAAEYTPDYALIRAIPTVAQVLCEAHAISHGLAETRRLFSEDVVYPELNSEDRLNFSRWGHWASETFYNHLWLRMYGGTLLRHYSKRFNRSHCLHAAPYWEICSESKIFDLTIPPNYGSPVVQTYREMLFSLPDAPTWSAPAKVPDWYATMVVESIMELVA